MGLLSRLKSLLGFGDDRPARRGNVDVTVEHEPGGSADAESERAVKEPASEQDADESAADATEPDSAPGEPAADETPEEDAEEPTAAEESTDADAAEQTGPAAESVDTIKGIGPSYAEKLSSAGVETVGDLAGADAEALGDETGLSPKRISGWIEQAEARTQ